MFYHAATFCMKSLLYGISYMLHEDRLLKPNQHSDDDAANAGDDDNNGLSTCCLQQHIHPGYHSFFISLFSVFSLYVGQVHP